MLELQFLPKLLLQHDCSPVEVLEDVQGAFLAAVRRREVKSSLSPSGGGLAVALGQRLVVFNLFDHRRSGGNAAVDFVSVVDAPETVTALVWLAAGGRPADECILAGTSAGCLQLHSAATGALLLRQPLHHGAVVAAAVRWSGCGSDPEDLTEDVTLAFSDAVVRVPAWEVWAAVRWPTGRGGGGGAAAGPMPHELSFSKFMLPKGAGPRSQAICLGPQPPSLYAALAGRQEPPRLHILTAGFAPPLATYEAEESAAPGLLSLVSDLASSTAASLLGRARAYVRRPAASAGRSLFGLRRRGGGDGKGGGDDEGGGGSDMQQQGWAGKKREKILGEPASLAAAVWDEKRCITHLALSPNGRLAACCDTLGRVLLVDAGSTLVVRMLKGYRDAQVAWLVCSKDGLGGSASGGFGSRHTASLATAAGSSIGSGLAPLGGSTSSLSNSVASGGLGSAADLASLPRQPGEPGSESEGTSAASSPAKEPAQRQQQQQQAAPPQQRQPREQGPPLSGAGGTESRQPARGGHLLVIYAPRRAVVELWEPQSLTQLGSEPCQAQLSMLLQQPARRGVSAPDASIGAAAAPFQPNQCLLLDADALTLTDLTAPLTGLL